MDILHFNIKYFQNIKSDSRMTLKNYIRKLKMSQNGEICPSILSYPKVFQEIIKMAAGTNSMFSWNIGVSVESVSLSVLNIALQRIEIRV